MKACWKRIACVLSCAALISAGAAHHTATAEENAAVKENAAAEESVAHSDAGMDDKEDEYTLKKVIVLSRHNIRSPLSDKDSVLGRITPHEWFGWTSPSSELSLKGGVLEVMMGQYFRKWMEHEGLIPENYIPEEGKIRFYANSKQRTIATARYFSSGMLPSAQVHIETHNLFNEMDETFTPKLHFATDEYVKDALSEIDEMGGDEGLPGFVGDLEDSFSLISDVIDLEDGEAYKKGELSGFATDDTEIILEEGKEPAMSGSLKTATTVSDALVLQYYEEADKEKAAFGKKLDEDDWAAISRVKDAYVDVLFKASLISVNVAYPLLEEIASEMDETGRVFSFLCGHDSNIVSVLSAIGCDEYELPDTIERKTPIGCKLVFSKWEAEDGKEYYKVELVYQSTSQLRANEPLSLENPPVRYPLTLVGLLQYDDGLYDAEDVEKRFAQVIRAYYLMEDEYMPAEQAA